MVELKGVQEGQLAVGLNARVQPVLSKSAPAPHWLADRGEQLKQIVDAFSETAQRVGKFVVDGLRTEPGMRPLQLLS